MNTLRITHHHPRKYLFHLRPPQRQICALHTQPGSPPRSKRIKHHPRSRSQDITLNREDGLHIPKRLRINGIRLPETSKLNTRSHNPAQPSPIHCTNPCPPKPRITPQQQRPHHFAATGRTPPWQPQTCRNLRIPSQSRRAPGRHTDQTAAKAKVLTCENCCRSVTRGDLILISPPETRACPSGGNPRDGRSPSRIPAASPPPRPSGPGSGLRETVRGAPTGACVAGQVMPLPLKRTLDSCALSMPS